MSVLFRRLLIGLLIPGLLVDPRWTAALAAPRPISPLANGVFSEAALCPAAIAAQRYAFRREYGPMDYGFVLLKLLSRTLQRTRKRMTPPTGLRRLALLPGSMIHEISHGVSASLRGFTVHWGSLRIWKAPRIRIDEMDTVRYPGPYNDHYHRTALAVSLDGERGNRWTARAALAALAGWLLFEHGLPPGAPNVFLLLGGFWFVVANIVEARGTRLNWKINSDRHRALYHREALTRRFFGTRRFGWTDQKFFILGLGTIGYGRPWPRHQRSYERPDDQEMAAHLDEAYLHLGNRNGVLMLDTAPAYGDAEARIGDYLRLHPERVAQTFIATKWGEEFDVATGRSHHDFSLASLQSSVQRSLVHLGKIDLLYVHIPGGATNAGLRDAAVRGALLDLKQAGSVRYIGASISKEATLAEAVDSNLIEGLDAIQMPADVFLKRRDLVRTIYERGIAIVLNRAISGEDPGETLRRLADRQEVSVILTGSRNHLADNADSLHELPEAPDSQFVMTDDDAKSLSNKLDHLLKTYCSDAGILFLRDFSYYADELYHSLIGDGPDPKEIINPMTKWLNSHRRRSPEYAVAPTLSDLKMLMDFFNPDRHISDHREVQKAREANIRHLRNLLPDDLQFGSDPRQIFSKLATEIRLALGSTEVFHGIASTADHAGPYLEPLARRLKKMAGLGLSEPKNWRANDPANPDEIRAMRDRVQRSGLSELVIAKTAGIDPSTLNRVLNDERRPSRTLVGNVVGAIHSIEHGTPFESTSLRNLSQASRDQIQQVRDLLRESTTRAEVSRRFGVDLSHLYRLYTGGRSPSRELAEKIIDLFGERKATRDSGLDAPMATFIQEVRWPNGKDNFFEAPTLASKTLQLPESGEASFHAAVLPHGSWNVYLRDLAGSSEIGILLEYDITNRQLHYYVSHHRGPDHIYDEWHHVGGEEATVTDVDADAVRPQFEDNLLILHLPVALMKKLRRKGIKTFDGGWQARLRVVADAENHPVSDRSRHVSGKAHGKKILETSA